MSKTAVITGSTSGMGAEFARRLAADGYDLVITGRRRELINKLADELRKKHGVNIEVIIAELSDDNDINKVIDAVNARDEIDILINNAGYSGFFKNFIDVEPTHYEQMIKVHQIVPIRLVSTVAPKMIKQGKGTIINISSIGAFNALPTGHVYCGTKSFLKMFSEGLYQELRDKGIKVQALCPGFTDTNFAKDYITDDEYGKLVKRVKKMMMTPEAVVNFSLKQISKNKVVCIPGIINKVMCFTLPKLPRGLYYRLAAKITEL